MKAVHWSGLPGALNTWLAERLKGWNATSRQTKAFHMMRFLIVLMLIGGGAVIRSSSTESGYLKVMEEHLPLVSVDEFGLITIGCGVALALMRRPSAKWFAVLTMPIVIYTGYAVQGVLLGRYGFSGAFLLVVMTAVLFVVYWGYSGDDRQ